MFGDTKDKQSHKIPSLCTVDGVEGGEGAAREETQLQEGSDGVVLGGPSAPQSEPAVLLLQGQGGRGSEWMKEQGKEEWGLRNITQQHTRMNHYYYRYFRWNSSRGIKVKNFIYTWTEFSCWTYKDIRIRDTDSKVWRTKIKKGEEQRGNTWENWGKTWQIQETMTLLVNHLASPLSLHLLAVSPVAAWPAPGPHVPSAASPPPATSPLEPAVCQPPSCACCLRTAAEKDPGEVKGNCYSLPSISFTW